MLRRGGEAGRRAASRGEGVEGGPNRGVGGRRSPAWKETVSPRHLHFLKQPQLWLITFRPTAFQWGSGESFQRSEGVKRLEGF